VAAIAPKPHIAASKIGRIRGATVNLLPPPGANQKRLIKTIQPRHFRGGRPTKGRALSTAKNAKPAFPPDFSGMKISCSH